MKLIYQGVDIYPEVSINSCIHEIYAEKRSDTLKIRFNDTKGLWNKWNPMQGDVIEVVEGPARTGKMFVTSIKPENGLYTLRAMSMPLSGEVVKNRSWEAVRFLQLGEQIAQEHGLTFKSYGVTDQVYPYLSQNSQTDFEFLQTRCMLEGCALVIYDGNLIIYDELYLESQPPAGEIYVGPDGVFEYQDNSAMSYGSAEVVSGGFKGKFTVAGNTSRILRPREPLKVTSDAEATRYAKALLRMANKYSYTGWIEDNLQLKYAAASVVRITTERQDLWNGPVFITHIRHDYVARKSKIFFRKPLEGY